MGSHTSLERWAWLAVPVRLQCCWGRLLSIARTLFLTATCATIATAAEQAAEAVQFIDIAERSGISEPVSFGNKSKNSYLIETTGTGAAILDYDLDGDNDVLIVNGVTLDQHREGTGRPSFLYRNNGKGVFTEVAEQAGLTKVGWGQGVCVGDYDNDGAPDLLLTYHGVDALYHNKRDGTFDDTTARAGLLTEGVRWGAGCAFFDYDKDGLLDLFIANYVDMALDEMPEPGSSKSCYWRTLPVSCGPRSLPKARNYLYRNRGGGRFEDVSDAAGILAPGPRFALGVVAADFNNDSWTDLYVACDQSPSLLYENRGDGTFEERALEAGVAYNFHGVLQAGMGVAIADYDGDGFLDIAKTNFQGDLPSLYVNEDGEFYEDLAQQAGLGANKLLGWGALFEDFDQDSFPDLFTANGHIYPEVDGAGIGESYRQRTLFYRNEGDGRFADMSAQAGPALQEARPARGVAAGDIDGDGRPEVLIVNVNEPPSLLKNTAAGGAYVSLLLQGTKSNRSAIGARITLEAGGRTQIRDVVGGGSYYSHSDFALFFGLGGSKAVDRVEIAWPSGERQEFRGLDTNARYLIVEGKEPAVR